MNAINNLKIFKINEAEWYMASSLSEAITLWENETGEMLIDYSDSEPYELSNDEMNTLTFITDNDEKMTFFRTICYCDIY